MVDLLHIVLAVTLNASQEQIRKRVSGVVRVAEVAAEVISALSVVDGIDAHVTSAPFPVKACFDLVIAFDPSHIVAQVAGTFGAVERPAIVESKRRCHKSSVSGSAGYSKANTRYGISSALSLSSVERNRRDQVLEVSIKHLIEVDRLATGIFEIRQGGGGRKG